VTACARGWPRDAARTQGLRGLHPTAHGLRVSGRRKSRYGGPLVAKSAGEEATMRQETTAVKVMPYQSAAGMLWLAGWLFTIGFAKLIWWKTLLGLAVWPYFLATAVR